MHLSATEQRLDTGRKIFALFTVFTCALIPWLGFWWFIPAALALLAMWFLHLCLQNYRLEREQWNEQALFQRRHLEQAQQDLKTGKTLASEHSRRIRLLASKSAYFECIFQDSLDPLFTTDNDLLVMKFNQGAIDLFGYTQEDILGKPVENLFRDRRELERLLRKLDSKGSGSTMDIRALTANGRVIHLNLSVATMDSQIYGGLYAGVVFSCQDISKRKIQEREMNSRTAELERLSRTDSLTNLYNQRQFHEDFVRMVQSSVENPGKMLTILVIDLDRFKQLNDQFGHQAGDLALQQFSQSLESSVRSELDPIYRYGGDEFVVILPDADSEQAQIVAHRIQENYSRKRSPENNTGVSIGIATFDGQESPESLFHRADDAMYRAKGGGGNRASI